jgi:LysR family transcriptional regulator, glycine cleavage system transcriptional activator
MRPELPPLIWLRAFEAAARHLSFTEAGRELNLTQAAISKHVKSLELHVRQQLFLRRTRSLQLTRMGEAYVPKVRDAFERLALGTREVFGTRQGNELTLRCAVSFAVNWLAPRLSSYLGRHPGKTIRVVSSVWNDSLDMDGCDLDIRYGTGTWSGIRSHRLTSETITPLCAPALARTLKAPNDLQSHRLLHVLGYQEGWGTWLRAADATSVHPGLGLQFDTSLLAFEAAACGIGVALGRRSLATRDRASGRLVAPFDLEVPITEAFHVLEPTDREPHPETRMFVDWLIETAALDEIPSPALPLDKGG